TEAAGLDPGGVGPRGPTLARLSRGGLRAPGGFVLNAEAYHAQIAALGLEPLLHRFDLADGAEQRRLSVEIRLALYEQPVAPDILAPLMAAWQRQRAHSAGAGAVRSSALVQDCNGTSFD